MPIYEYYCQPCNTIFSFFTRKIGTKESPACPRCQGELQRRVSMFSFKDTSNPKKDISHLPLPDKSMEEGMHKLAREVEKLRDTDPAAKERLLKRFTEISGGVRFDEMFDKNPARTEEPEEEPSTEKGSADEDEPERDENLYEF